MPKELSEKIISWPKARANLAARWVAPKNLHITLVPPWNEINISEIIGQLQTVSANNFEIKFENIITAPNKNMIWLAGKPPEGIYGLRLKIYEALGKKPDARPFKLHATLARSKTHLPSFKEMVNWQYKAEKFVLYESQLMPEGADYEILQNFKLD